MQIESLRADGVAGTSDLNRNKVISDGPVWPIQYLLIQVLFGGLPNPVNLCKAIIILIFMKGTRS